MKKASSGKEAGLTSAGVTLISTMVDTWDSQDEDELKASVKKLIPSASGVVDKIYVAVDSAMDELRSALMVPS